MNLIELSAQEIQGRVSKCQAKMEEQGLEGLLLSDESNVNYFSDFRTHAPRTTYTRPNFIFIPKKGKPVMLLQTFIVPEARAVSKGCEVRGFDSLLGPTAEELRDIMDELDMTKGNIGFELGFEQRIGFQMDVFLALKGLLSEAEFVDAADLLWSLRMIKSPVEIDCLKMAGAATSFAHDKVFKHIKKGMTEFEISQLCQQFMIEGGAENPGFVIITSGEGNYGRISKINSNRKLEEGDYLWLDLGAQHKGYWSDFCRSGVVGEISEERNTMQNKIYEVTMRAAESLKPGVPVSDVARACGRELERAGFEATFDCGRFGHGMGLLSTEPPSVTIYDNGILQEGMAVNLEPGIVTDIGVFVLEENFVVTKDGFDIMSGGDRRIHRI